MSAADLGTDLSVILGPPDMAAHDTSSLDVRRSARPAPVGAGEIDDLARVDGRENLAQALILRLLTPRGALADLGHGAYGSRLGELIGRAKDESARALCKAFVLEAVAQEPRVEDEAVAFAFDPQSEGPSDLRFTLVVQPRTTDGPVTVDLVVGL
jgi:phage baseplate assembly protein W